MPELERRVITYGFSTQADVYSREQTFDKFTSTSELYYKNEKIGVLKLNVPGMHSIQNAMAAVSVGLDLDMPIPTILEALEAYTGIGRRFELKQTVNGIMIFEDYAHHPTEIIATLEAAKRGWPRRTVVVFQPHRYSRLSSLMKKFATSFNQADVLFITEVYPAGEKPIESVSGQVLFEETQKFGHKNIYFEPDLSKIAALVAKTAEPEDLIFILGAGSINKIIPELITELGEK
jgi:UDP-N-acetylmuramate--alanine ligase